MAPYLSNTASGALIDPSTQKTEPVYSLSIEGLEKYLTYSSHESGLSNSLQAKADLPAGSHICYITAHNPVPKPAWSSVQSGKASHLELGSGLVYTNHSCDPNVEFRLFSPDSDGTFGDELPYELPKGQPRPVPGEYGLAGEVRVAAHRSLKAGEDLSFFYPSSEWDSAKPFHCLCGTQRCLGEIRGAKALGSEKLGGYYVNPHIMELVKERDGGN